VNALKANSLVKKYTSFGGEVIAVNGVDFTADAGEFVAIVGDSGSGKSTLLHLLGGLDYPDKGSIKVGGMEFPYKNDEELTAFRRRNIGFVFQQYNLIPVLSVEENIILPVTLDGDDLDEAYFSHVASTLGIQPLLKRFPSQLSGGEQQRAAIARALICKPIIILADEPTGNLDSKTSIGVANMLKLNRSQFNQTIVMVTHNLEVAKVADRIIMLQDGRISKVLS